MYKKKICMQNIISSYKKKRFLFEGSVRMCYKYNTVMNNEYRLSIIVGLNSPKL